MRFCIWRARALLRAENFSAMADFFSAAAEMFSAQSEFFSANGGKVFRHTSKYRVFSAEFNSASGGKEIRPSGKNIRRGGKKIRHGGKVFRSPNARGRFRFCFSAYFSIPVLKFGDSKKQSFYRQKRTLHITELYHSEARIYRNSAFFEVSQVLRIIQS